MPSAYNRKSLTFAKRQELFHREKKIFLGYGLDVGEMYKPSGDHSEVEVWLEQDVRKRHTLVVGTTGSGKTVLLSSLAKADILSGNRIVYVDPKGDEDLFKTFVTYAKMTGRFTPETFMFLSPMYLDYSIELNPLWGLDPDEAATVLVSSIPDGKEPFFKKVAFMVLLAILLGKAANNKNPGNYPSIYEVTLAFSLNKLKTLEEEVHETLKLIATTDNERLAMYAADASLVLEHLTSADEAYFEKVTTTLKAEIDVLVTGAVGQVIGKAKTNRLVERLRNDEDVIFLAYLGALRFGDEIVGRAARMIFASIQRLTGKMYQEFKTFEPALSIFGDEAKNLFYNGIEDLFNKVRGANVMLTFATQSLGDIVAALGDDKTQSIIGNANTQIYMKATDKYTTAHVENASITVDVAKPLFTDKELGLSTTSVKAIQGPFLNELKAGAFYASVDGLWYQLYTPYEKVPENLDFKPADVFAS
jgi:type IV secretory pathway TraG/TraD family ATPase VirD4